jgi:hypothetical protein
MAVFIVVRQKAKDGTARFHVRWQPGRKHPQVHLGSFKTREEAELRKRRTELLIAQGRVPAPEMFSLSPRASKPRKKTIRSHPSISTRMRFTVLERDGFTCQYCGRSAPDVELQVDHVHPQSLGGATVLENLVTACVECNVGKSARVVQKLREAEENG